MKRFLLVFLVFLLALVVFLRFDRRFKTFTPFFGGSSSRPVASRLQTPTARQSTTRTVETQRSLFPLSSNTTDSVDKMTLASFNIRVFSSNSRSDTEIAKICDVLERYDIIAIQELRDEDALKRACSVLATRGRAYSYLISSPVGSKTQKELYAILYRSDTIAALNRGTVYPDKNSEFIREPFYASLRCGNFDFTLITVHILYKEKNAPERKIELDAIARVFKEVQNADKNENDVILTGDFNEDPASPRFHMLRAIDTLDLIINGIKTVIYDSSTYDNIIFQKMYTGYEFTGDWGVYKFDEEMYNNDDATASKEVSDHRPVWASFWTNKPDDD